VKIDGEQCSGSDTKLADEIRMLSVVNDGRFLLKVGENPRDVIGMHPKKFANLLPGERGVRKIEYEGGKTSFVDVNGYSHRGGCMPAVITPDKYQWFIHGKHIRTYEF
jgi:hypothetical protein